MKIQIYASEITNLTDARYFAAAGVDYMGFCCEEGHNNFVPEKKIREIIEWVEGPAGILQFSGWEDHSMMENYLSTTSCAGLHVGISGFEIEDHPFVMFKNVLPDMLRDYHLQGQSKYILKITASVLHNTNEAIMDIKNLCEKYICYIDLEYYPENFAKILKIINPAGIVIRGGDEEKTGIKSYEILDELFTDILD